jgi:MscS family membrane protein
VHQALVRVVLFLITTLLSLAALAEPPESCKSPRDAVDSVFGWLSPEHHNPAKATRCLDRTGRSSREVRESALRIKAIYAARALKVDPEKFSDEPGWVNPETRRTSFLPHEALPGISVEKQADGMWRWSRSTLDVVDEVYEDSLLIGEHGLVRRLPAWMRARALGMELWQGLALSLILVLALMLRQVIRFVLKNRLASFAERRGARLAAELVKVVATPGALMLAASMLRLAYPELGLPLGVAIVSATVVRVLLVVAVVLALYRLVDVLAAHLSLRAEASASRLDDQMVPLLRTSLKVVLVLAGILVLLQNLNVNVASLLAGLGIGGLAMALAAKDTIANFFASIMIFVDRPFRIGDWIKVEDVEGQVEEVGFRSTRIRTLADSLITLPNARLAEAKIDNLGARRHRRIHGTFALPLDTSVERIEAFVEGLRAILWASDKTRKDNFEVHLNQVASASLEVSLHCYVEVSSWSDELSLRHDLLLEILRLAEALGVRFALPTRAIHVESLAASGPARKAPEPLGPADLAPLVDGFARGGAASRLGTIRITDGHWPRADAPE